MEDCVRFVSNKDFEFQIRPLRLLTLKIQNYYYLWVGEWITFQPSFSSYLVYIGDNYLNSYLSMKPLYLDWGSRYHLSVEKAEIENKLGEPCNDCDESLDVAVK